MNVAYTYTPTDSAGATYKFGAAYTVADLQNLVDELKTALAVSGQATDAPLRFAVDKTDGTLSITSERVL